MKTNLFIMILLLGIIEVSCSSKENEANIFSISSDELIFESNGGEESVKIVSADTWIYDCDANWITIRRNQDGLRIITEKNLASDSRSSYISIYVENSLRARISVKQEALPWFDNKGDIHSAYEGGIFKMKNVLNNVLQLKTEVDWINAVCDHDSITIIVDRNYNLQNRVSTLYVGYGSNTFEVSILQDKSPWFESLELIHIDGGSFLMGAQCLDNNEANFNIDALSVESPIHKVNISPFDICAFEITQEQWAEAMGSNPSVSQLGGKYPIENISWNDVQEFIKKLNELSGKKYRLPTEAEWEYAAQGGILQNPYQFSGANLASSVAWFSSNSNSFIHEVGQKLPNSLGIFDMTGNVSEWVNDWFSEYQNNEVSDPKGPATGLLKITRGGSCLNSSQNCRNTFRNLTSPEERNGEIGFRLVLTE